MLKKYLQEEIYRLEKGIESDQKLKVDYFQIRLMVVVTKMMKIRFDVVVTKILMVMVT